MLLGTEIAARAVRAVAIPACVLHERTRPDTAMIQPLLITPHFVRTSTAAPLTLPHHTAAGPSV